MSSQVIRYRHSAEGYKHIARTPCSLTRTFNESLISCEGLVPLQISGPCITWPYCQFHVRRSRDYPVGIRKLKNANVRLPIPEWWSYQVSWKVITAHFKAHHRRRVNSLRLTRSSANSNCHFTCKVRPALLNWANFSTCKSGNCRPTRTTWDQPIITSFTVHIGPYHIRCFHTM